MLWANTFRFLCIFNFPRIYVSSSLFCWRVFRLNFFCLPFRWGIWWGCSTDEENLVFGGGSSSPLESKHENLFNWVHFSLDISMVYLLLNVDEAKTRSSNFECWRVSGTFPSHQDQESNTLIVTMKVWLQPSQPSFNQTQMEMLLKWEMKIWRRAKLELKLKFSLLLWAFIESIETFLLPKKNIWTTEFCVNLWFVNFARLCLHDIQNSSRSTSNKFEIHRTSIVWVYYLFQEARRFASRPVEQTSSHNELSFEWYSMAKTSRVINKKETKKKLETFNNSRSSRTCVANL